MNSTEEQKSEEWLEALRGKGQPCDRLDQVLSGRLRAVFQAEEEKSEPEDLNASRLKEQFLFRLRKEGLITQKNYRAVRARWIAVAASVAVAALVAPMLVEQYGTNYPDELGQPKSGPAFQYQQTGPKSYRANLSQDNIKLVANEVKAELDRAGIEYTSESDELRQILRFQLDDPAMATLNAALAKIGMEFPQTGFWEIVLVEE